MTNHILLGEYNGKISVLLQKYAVEIREEEIFKYIEYTLHKHLNMDNVNAIMSDIGSIHGRFKLEHDNNDSNGLYKIYKVTYGILGYVTDQRLVARFWIDSNKNGLSPKEFVDGVTPEDPKCKTLTPELVQELQEELKSD